jgi:hypothetical protein
LAGERRVILLTSWLSAVDSRGLSRYPEVHNQNPLPPYEDYCQVKRRTKYTYDAIDMSALKNVDDPESYLGNAGVEYEQGWMKQDVAPDVKFGVAGTHGRRGNGREKVRLSIFSCVCVS